MRLLFLTLVLLLAVGCDRQGPVQQGSPNEGKAAQSAAGGSANEGKAARSAR
jgi:hypothetical protein